MERHIWTEPNDLKTSPQTHEHVRWEQNEQTNEAREPHAWNTHVWGTRSQGPQVG